MRTVLLIVAVVMGLALAAPVMAQSTDYSKMSTDQLYQLRQQGVPAEDRSNLAAEWQKRVADMTPQELKKYQVPYSHEEVQKMYRGQSGTSAPSQ